MSQRFYREERLKSVKEIADVFETGNSVFVHPLKLVFTKIEDSIEKPKLGFTVPKKAHRKAHDRNLLKRRIREAYRLHSQDFKTWALMAKLGFHIMIIYVDKTILEYTKIEESLKKALSKLIRINDGNTTSKN